MTEHQLERLVRLRPQLLNIVGFHDIMDSKHDLDPLDAMKYEAYFKSSSLFVAREVWRIIDELLDDAGFDYDRPIR